ncbi:hypothetical protein VB776_23595 [Arcicella sp. DC2W]|uniref:Metallo-beta-lactamase domain-containing protein n=1 Tax=Arcicella gelida TaxID=2984195 RepID=A0ABU5SBV5_9BACT|nr:hypothetical protein [Arcicella sp. DC2W]MEA5405943.1 hypothetical protein [Arcicella sp. DC2W]
MTFSQKFTIHPVGQGLFYSGILKIGTKVKFSMVFDCGTKSVDKAIQTEIDLYRTETNISSTKTLDLLIISHFDKDHVSHIEKLLDGNIKVKTLIMPFITFQERLFLVLRFLSQSKGNNSNKEFIIKFILDPFGTLKNNLDDNSEIYLIDGEDLGSPIPQIENSNQDTYDFSENESFTIVFEEGVKSELEDKDIEKTRFKPNEAKVYKVNHRNKGTLKTSIGLALMEFLFYKRNIGEEDKDFFDKIEKLFFAKYALQLSDLSAEHKLDKIIEIIKGINSFKGSGLQQIFVDAQKEISSQADKIKKEPLEEKEPQYLDIKDSNTTSLCLLHKNLISGLSKNQQSRTTQIQKFMTPQNRVNIPWFNYYHYSHWSNKTFPNVLLTSDTFLLKPVQVTPFREHYKYYWNDFWLFQIPHHGSEKSSDSLLHSNIPLRAYNFINYGIPNTDKHPDQSVIKDLVATGHSVRLIPVTQYQGLFFELIYP